MPKNISRYEYGGTEGWLVRLYEGGKERSKLFTDKKYGGKEKARVQAIKFRDLQADEKYIRESAKTPKRFIASSERNTSGTIGVSRVEKRERSGEVYGHWQASWREDGKTKTRSFSAKKYGEQEARRKATIARHRAMVRIHGEAYTEQRENNDLLPSDDEIYNS